MAAADVDIAAPHSVCSMPARSAAFRGMRDLESSYGAEAGRILIEIDDFENHHRSCHVAARRLDRQT